MEVYFLCTQWKTLVEQGHLFVPRIWDKNLPVLCKIVWREASHSSGVGLARMRARVEASLIEKVQWIQDTLGGKNWPTGAQPIRQGRVQNDPMVFLLLPLGLTEVGRHRWLLGTEEGWVQWSWGQCPHAYSRPLVPVGTDSRTPPAPTAGTRIRGCSRPSYKVTEYGWSSTPASQVPHQGFSQPWISTLLKLLVHKVPLISKKTAL